MLACKENGAEVYIAGPPDGSCREERPRSADLSLWWPRESTSVRRRTVLAMCCDAVLRRAATIQNDDAEHDWLAQDKGGGQTRQPVMEVGRSWPSCLRAMRMCFQFQGNNFITKLHKMGAICFFSQHGTNIAVHKCTHTHLYKHTHAILPLWASLRDRAVKFSKLTRSHHCQRDLLKKIVCLLQRFLLLLHNKYVPYFDLYIL